MSCQEPGGSSNLQTMWNEKEGSPRRPGRGGPRAYPSEGSGSELVEVPGTAWPGWGGAWGTGEPAEHTAGALPPSVQVVRLRQRCAPMAPCL